MSEFINLLIDDSENKNYAAGDRSGFINLLSDTTEETSILGEIPKGLKAGVQQIRGMGYGIGAIAGEATGIQPVTDWAIEGLADVEAKTPKPAVGSFSEIENISDAAKYLTYGVASNLPNMALSFTGGGIGAVLGKKAVETTAKAALTKLLEKAIINKGIRRGAIAGAAGASIGMEAGSIAGDQLTETGKVDPLRALAGAVPAGLLDVVPEWYLVKRLGLFGDITGFAGKGIKDRLVQGGKEALKQFGLEAPTEAMQSVIERASVPGKSISNREAWDEYINSFILGGATGAVVGGGGGVFTKADTPVQKVLKSDPLANQLETAIAENDPDGITKPPVIPTWIGEGVPVRQPSQPIVEGTGTAGVRAKIAASREAPVRQASIEEAQGQVSPEVKAAPEEIKAVLETGKIVSPEIKSALQKSTPIPVKEAVKTKAQTKETLTSKLDSGEILEDTPVRLTTIDELRGMIKSGKLYVGEDFEGRPGISAQTIRKGSPIVAYGSNTKISAAIIFPNESIEETGEAVNEVKMNPGTALDKLRFVIGGHPELLTYKDIQNLYQAKAPAPKIQTEDVKSKFQKAAEEAGGTLDGEYLGMGAWSVTDGVTKSSFMVKKPEDIAIRFAEARKQAEAQKQSEIPNKPIKIVLPPDPDPLSPREKDVFTVEEFAGLGEDSGHPVAGAVILTKDGIAYSGATHVEALELAESKGIKETDITRNDLFITNDGTLITREQGDKLVGVKTGDAADIVGRRVTKLELVKAPHLMTADEYIMSRVANYIDKETYIGLSGKKSYNNQLKMHKAYIQNAIIKDELTPAEAVRLHKDAYPDIEAWPEMGKKEGVKQIYRASGREDIGSAYNELTDKKPLLENGQFWAFNEKDTKEYGPNVESKPMPEFSNPLTIKNDEQWRKIVHKALDKYDTKQERVSYPNPFGMSPEKMVKWRKGISDYLAENNHDALVVDIEEAKGSDNAKALFNAFGHSQVFIPSAPTAAKPAEPPLSDASTRDIPEKTGADKAEIEAVKVETQGEAKIAQSEAADTIKGLTQTEGKGTIATREKIAKRKADENMARAGNQFQASKVKNQTTGISQPDLLTKNATVRPEGNKAYLESLREKLLFRLSPASGKVDFQTLQIDGKNAGFIKGIAGIFGKKVQFFRSETPELRDHYLGFVDQKIAPDTIFLNVQSPAPHLQTIGHELMHQLQTNDIELYQEFLDEIRPFVINLENYKALMIEHKEFANDSQMFREFTAEFIEHRFMDQKFWDGMMAKNPSVFSRVMKYLTDILNRVKEYIEKGRDIDKSYITDIDKARQVAINTLSKYQAKQSVFSTDEEIKEYGLEGRKIFDLASPESTTFLNHNRPNYISKLQDWLISNGYDEKAEKLAIYLWDEKAPLSRVQKGIGKQSVKTDYDMARRLMGSAIVDEVKEFDKKSLQPLLQHIADNNLKIADIEEFTHAEHAPERNLQMKRVNARRYADSAIGQMTKNEKAPYEKRLFDINDEFVMNDQSLNERRDNYVRLIDEIASTIINTQDEVSSEIDVRQRELDNRTFTDIEIEKGTPERLQIQIDNSRKRFQERLRIAKQWEDVKDRLSGMTYEQAEEISKKYSGKKAMKEAADILRAINESTLEMHHDSGNLSDGEYRAMKSAYKKHVPLMREDFEDKKQSIGRGGVGPLAKPLKIAAGSTRGVANIFAHVIDRHQAAINIKHELEAGKILVEMVKANPDESKWEIIEQDKKPRYDNEGNIRLYEDRNEDNNEVYVKVNGEKILISVPKDNAPMMRWMETVKRQNTPLGPVVNASKKLTRFMAALNTSFSPEFLLSNFTKDLQTAMIHLEDSEAAGFQKKVFENIKSAIKGVYEAERGNENSDFAKLYRQYSKLGGKIAWMQSYDSVTKLAENIQKELDYKRGKYPNKEKLRKLGEWIGAMNTSVENGVRLSTFKALIDSGVAPIKAAQIAKTLTVDFTQHGTAGPMINAFYMFANAGIQGNVRMIKAIASSRKVQKIVGGIAFFGFAANIIGAMAGGDDDDGESYYDKLKRTNPGMFERNMVFMIPNSKGKYIKIPMPYGYNIFFVLGNEIASSIRGNSPIESASNAMSALMGTLNPLASATLLQTVMPTVLDPVAQVFENKAWHGGKLMPEKNPFGFPIPDSERYFQSVNPIAKYFSSVVNTLTGGDKYKPGLIDVSPETIEMIFETYTGSAGRFTKDVLSIPSAAVSDDGLSVGKIPFARKFIGSSPDFINTQIYQENHDKVDILLKRFEEADMNEKKEIMKDPLFSMRGIHKATDSMLRKLNKRLKTIKKTDNKELIKKLRAKMLEMEINYNRAYNRRKD